MKKNVPLYVYGAIIIFAGFFLLFSKTYSFQSIKYNLGVTLIFGSIVAFINALSRQRKQVEFSYHEIHSISMLVYGICVLMFANTVETLINLTAFLMFFYAFSEIIFCNWLFNLGKKVVLKIVIIRVILGLMVGMGTIVVMHLNSTSDVLDIEGFGILFIIIGINILLYVPVMRSRLLDSTLE